LQETIVILMTRTAVVVFGVSGRMVFPSLVTENAERYGLIGMAFSLFSWFFVNQTIVVLAALVGAVIHEHRPGRPSTDGPTRTMATEA
jgi:uncharacterized BrkB/YihY/UPF0761 family membrane protein